MADPITVRTITLEDTATIVASAKRLLKFGQALSVLTPTTVDDKFLTVLNNFVTAVEPFASDQSFIDIVNYGLSFFKGKTVTEAANITAEAVEKLNEGQHAVAEVPAAE